ncbi:transketolase [Clostridia bacterium]|nr:transketolase [Clostridia bacterium]
MGTSLKETARKVRVGIIDGVHAAKSGHPGGSLGIADVMTYLYFEEMNIDPKNPGEPQRDRFVLSKGHNAPALYSALANRGYFPVSDLLTLRRLGSHLQGHPSLGSTPGVDMSTGSLGQGISAACGMALAAKLSGDRYRVYSVMGDGEIAEGECWEAFMFAAHYKLDNLCVVIDVNGLQIDGATKDVMNSAPLDKKLDAFGFRVIVIDGNDFGAIASAFAAAKTVKGQPTCILAKTTKGKGVSFMENQAGWHGKAPNDEEHAKAIAELEASA